MTSRKPGRTAVILGTRPEIIKMSPVVEALKASNADFYLLHTGQHYSYELDKVFFEQLHLDPPSHNIGSGSGSHAEETAKMLVGIEKVLIEEETAGVLVEGDTNTVLAGALAASKLGVKVGHVEAGLRSGDRSMPEELNRTITDHLSDMLFAPTGDAKANLRREGISSSKIFITGNTIVDAVKRNASLARKTAPREIDGGDGRYMLATVHRQENVDTVSRFRGILDGLESTGKKFGTPVIYPVHPRADRVLEANGLKKGKEWVRFVQPVDYLRFLSLETGAELILTDSGGVQEEACILKVPCVTLRDNTERPETIRVGANVLAGADPGLIVKMASRMIGRSRNWRNPFGDGRASHRIAKAWTEFLG